MTAPVPTWKQSYAAYVAREELSDVKHEYIDGEIYPMSGGSPEHAAIISSVTYELVGQLRGGPCRPLTTELRTRVRADDVGPEIGSYPDIAVVCGKVVRDEEDPNSIVNPTLLVEVLSRSWVVESSYPRFEPYWT